MLLYLGRNFDGTGFRGVIGKGVLDASGGLENNPFNDFAADTLWLGKIARQGELHRVPYPLYKKRYHSNNTHLRWFEEKKEHQRRAWEQHCLDLLHECTKRLSLKTS
jgi:hypothetical protein